MHDTCLVHPVLLYLNVDVLKVFYEQTNERMNFCLFAGLSQSPITATLLVFCLCTT